MSDLGERSVRVDRIETPSQMAARIRGKTEMACGRALDAMLARAIREERDRATEAMRALAVQGPASGDAVAHLSPVAAFKRGVFAAIRVVVGA